MLSYELSDHKKISEIIKYIIFLFFIHWICMNNFYWYALVINISFKFNIMLKYQKNILGIITAICIVMPMHNEYPDSQDPHILKIQFSL